MSNTSPNITKTLDRNCYEKLIDYLKRGRHGAASFFSQSEKEKLEQDKQDVNKMFDIKISCKNYDSWPRPIERYEIAQKKGLKKWSFLVVPISVLYMTSTLDVREQLLMEEKIQGVIILKKLFFPNGTVPVGIIVIGDEYPDSIWLTSAVATDDVIQIFSDISQYQRSVFFTPKLDSKSFMPEFYSGDKEEAEEALNKICSQDVVRLEDISDIILGKSAAQDDFGDGEGIFYIRPRDIKGAGICNPEIYVKESSAVKYAKQLLQEGDILVSKNFGQRKIAIVTSENLPAMASSGLFIVRPIGISETFLFQYLTSNTGKKIFDKQLNSIETGAFIRTINLKDFKEIRVPLFDEQTMFEFMRVDELSIEDVVHLMATLNKNRTGIDEKQFNSAIERRVFHDLLNVGWNEQEIQLPGKAIKLQSGKWKPDITLLNGSEIFAAIEIKSDFMMLTPDWIRMIHEVMNLRKVPFLILSTGFYYEIHYTQSSGVKKMSVPPTKEMLSSILEEKGVG